MRPISDIYTEYKIISNLREHMFRVAGVAMQICDSLEVPEQKETIIKACLLHDMGNVIKFNLSHFPQFLEPEGLDYWKKVQIEFMDKYGKNEHEANLKIAKELGSEKEVLSCINAIGFPFWCQVNESGNIAERICSYADTRVAPYGVVSVHERLADGYNRYKDTDHPVDLKKETPNDFIFYCLYCKNFSLEYNLCRVT